MLYFFGTGTRSDVDLSKLTQGEKIMAGGAVALFLSAFLPWFGITTLAGFGASHSGWDNFLSVLAVLIGMALVAQVVVDRFTTTKLPELKMPYARLDLILGATAFGLVVLQFLAGDTFLSFTMGRRYGIFVGLIAAATTAYGSYLVSRQPEPASGGSDLV